jgi:hypothetical protein
MKLLAKPFRKHRKAASSASPVDPITALAQRLPDSTQQQREIIASVSETTMTSPERILALCDAAEYVSRHQIEGDIVECGVWKGGSTAAAARTLINCNDTDRTLWMYDTYEGMSAPSSNDVDLHGKAADQLLANDTASSAEAADSIWCKCSLETVKQTMASTVYPTDKICYIKGKVEDTLPLQSPEKIAILRLDTDWYESTRCELEILFPKLVVGGVLIIDDYGHWQGCRKAVDEYFADHRIKMFLQRIDYTGRVGIKTHA